MCPRRQGHCRRCLASTLAEVPLVDGQGDVKTEVELVLGEESGDAAHNSLVETSTRHEGMQSDVEFLLTCIVRVVFDLSSLFHRVCLIAGCLVAMMLMLALVAAMATFAVSVDVDKTCLRFLLLLWRDFTFISVCLLDC